MADECISVRFEDGRTWDYCWENTTPEPTWDKDNVTTGLRKDLGGKPWRTCQYYMKGMSATCSFWQKGTGEHDTIASGIWNCHYKVENTSNNPNDPPPDTPTGFNSGLCDNLGRRSWCDKYDPSTSDNLNEWICVAPNPYITGLGRRTGGTESPIISALTREDIWGYNDAENDGVGRCDCYGMGRGAPGCARVSAASPDADSAKLESDLSKLVQECNYYKPWQMGFGAIAPHTKEPGDVETDRVTVTDQGLERALQPLEKRLPLNYKLYNLRSQSQKCQWWDKDEGSAFVMDSGEIVIEDEQEGDPFDDAGVIEFCKCPDPLVNDYKTRALETSLGIAYFAEGGALTRNVWAVAGGPICNGARPECPCYTGKWEYLVEEKMFAGMPVTANQILELRFWASEWETQEQYNEFFIKKPNFDDPRDPAIYTFTEWANRGATAEDSSMKGKKLSLCQPVPLNNREFIPELYITSELVEYGPLYIDIGTTASDQRRFPSLIRDPELVDLKPLTVVYPYYNDEIFDVEVCESQGPAGHIKRHNIIYGDSISVVGHTIRDKNVYILNLNFVEVSSTLFYDYNSIFAMPRPLREGAYSELTNMVLSGLIEFPKYTVKTVSDDEFGYFISDPVGLEYNTANKLLICVDFGDGTWEFRKRQVNSLWCGGLIVQSEYKHEYGTNNAGYTNSQPESIESAATAEFDLRPLGGSETTNAFSVYSHEKTTVVATTRYYSYTIIKTREEDIVDVDGETTNIYWAVIGNSSLIWLQIEDLNLNYIYDWEIKSAVLEPKEDDETGALVREHAVATEMEVVDTADSDTIPPNSCILRPIDDNIRMRFLQSEWTLTITYEYQELVNREATDGEVIIAGGGKTALDIYQAAPFSLTLIDNTLDITSIDEGTVGIMAYFNDANNRLISTMATKACLNIISERCRSVDIFYRYEANGRRYALQPETGFCIDIKNDKTLPGLRKHIETPDCGDHDMPAWKWEGPMWYPFNVCRGYDMYDEFTICNNCQASYVGPFNEGMVTSNGQPVLGPGNVIQRYDYRYCGPYKYDAWGAVRGNWAAACDCGCKFYYSDASDDTAVLFTGYARIRGPILLDVHLGTPPPYGNDGREIIEKFISQDFVHHYKLQSIETREEWMPMVMDNSMFFLNFDAFDIISSEENSYTPAIGIDSFLYANQFNFRILQNINESIDYDSRYRFDELFDVHFEGNCTYPKPTLQITQWITRTNFYYLKLPDAAWAWQELWKDIERNLDMELPEGALGTDDTTVEVDSLDFITEYEKPKYTYSVYKEEHRLICDEGTHTIKYTAPKMDEESGEFSKYPTLQLDSGPIRAFQIIYDTYDDSLITWMDEGGEANVGGSSDEDNVYEETSGSEWIHDEHTLFEFGASITTSGAEADGKRIDIAYTGPDLYRYYNRGIIPKIYKDRLDYLPKTESIYLFVKAGQYKFISGSEEILLGVTNEYIHKSYFPELGNYLWDAENIIIQNIESQNIAIYKLVIEGKWGYSKGSISGNEVENITVKPGISSITLEFTDGSSGSPRNFNSYVVDVEYPDEGQSLEDYIINLQFTLGPKEMITKRIENFTINLKGSSLDNHYVAIDSIKLHLAEYIDIVFEGIKTWERKYIASEYNRPSGAINLDGPGDNLRYNMDLFNSGLYFPFKLAGSKSRPDEELAAADKTKAIYSGVYYSEDESIDINYNNLHQVEEAEQQRLYNYAIEKDGIGDTATYSLIMPYRFEEFLENNSPADRYGGTAIFTSELLIWAKHARTKQFEQYEYWRPGGHYYTWNPNFRREKCMLFGEPDDVYSGYYAHVDHVGVGTPLEVDPSAPIDPGNSYYSLRFYTKQAKYNRWLILSNMEPEGGNDLVSAANPYNPPLGGT